MDYSNQEHTNILVEASTLIAEGYGEEYKTLTKKIKSEKEKAELPEKLKKIYEKIGNTPIAEPELFELTEEVGKEEKSIIDIVLRFLSEDDMDEFSIEEVSSFAGMIMRKVRDHKDEKGVYKQTPNTEGWQRPKPSHIKKYEKLVKKLQKAKVKEDADEKAKINEEFEDFLFKTSTLSAENLSEWEKTLVVKQTTDAIKGYLNSFMGKR